MTDEIHPPPPATRIEVALTAIEHMLDRASRVVNIAETSDGRLAVLPVDTFRMNLMAIRSALTGETRAEQLALDDQGAAAIAEILHAARDQRHLVLSVASLGIARQLYNAAAIAGKGAEFSEHGATAAQYRAVERAAMMLGEILFQATREQEGCGDVG